MKSATKLTNRELVINVANHLPPDAPLVEIIERIELISGIKQAMAEAERGEGISVDEARRLIKGWTSK